ncbi:MAG: protein kinase domain-containing protein, partial [Acidimicrobiales bacterium]
VLAALAAAHDAGMLHRDIKPGNVLATEEGAWKVGDFGIAKSTDMVDPNLTSTGMVVGTPAYLAPERITGADATPSADLYAVGAICYEGLSGRKLSKDQGWATDRPGSIAGLRQERLDVPGPVVSVLEQATHPDPERRFTSARAMAAALATAAAAPVGGTSVMPARTTVLAAEPLPYDVVEADAERSRRGLYALLALAAIVLVVLLILLLANRNHSPNTPATTVPPPTTTPTTQPTTTSTTQATTTTLAPTTTATTRATTTTPSTAATTTTPTTQPTTTTALPVPTT